MKLILLSLITIFLIICVLFYEYFQMKQNLSKLNELKETFVEDQTLEQPPVITSSSSLCDNVDVSDRKLDIFTMNTLFGELNKNLNNMSDNIMSYYNLL